MIDFELTRDFLQKQEDERRAKAEFKTYQIMTPSGPIPCMEDHLMDAQRMYCINMNNMLYNGGTYSSIKRRPIRDFFREAKRRLSGAWYVLRYGGSDD